MGSPLGRIFERRPLPLKSTLNKAIVSRLNANTADRRLGDLLMGVSRDKGSPKRAFPGCLNSGFGLFVGSNINS